MEEDLGSSHLPVSCGLHILGLPTIGTHQSGLRGRPSWAGLLPKVSKVLGVYGVMKELSAVHQLMETLLISERHHGLRKDVLKVKL